ncbi:restriction endonuclease subunit S [Citrobacter portucalensis]|uniref:restriction endonuclease subunit S n=1 Tax=Citrobacter portucalensis TaxID=1639133 RepID=UPI00226B9092|nr:restriction endonuclease subunit S [Citrobacter portucalensis]MCX8971303.1 restriction endonuclease subunit S [Citrobacter portucalensis]MCX9037639.1 restriction endonuclease subunit S [Citrobacter portucalensis]
MIPKGWSSQKLSSVASIIDCKHRTPEYVKSGIPLVSPGTIKWGAIDLISPVKRVTEEEYRSLMDHCVVEQGDLVMSRNQSVGVVSYVDSKKPFVLGQDTVLIKPIHADWRFIYYTLQSDLVQRQIAKSAGGSTFSRINLSDIRALNIKTPAICEQDKISQILSAWDKAISVTESLLTNSQQQKKALMQQLLTGRKRLLDENGVRYGGEWHRAELGAVLDYIQPTPYLVDSTDYNDSYSIPVLTAGKSFILGYTNEEHGIYHAPLPAIIFDDFTTDSKFVDFEFKAKSSAMKILTAKNGVSAKYIFEAMQMLKFKIGGHQRHWISIYSNLVIPVPDTKEQQKIAAVLSAADAEISTLEKKIACLKGEKKALMQQLLTGKRRVKVDAEEAVSA